MTVLTEQNHLRRRESCLDLHRRSVDDSTGAEDHAVAGAVAGMVADGLMHPFDTISTRVKVQHDPSRYVGVASVCFVYSNAESTAGSQRLPGRKWRQ